MPSSRLFSSSSVPAPDDGGPSWRGDAGLGTVGMARGGADLENMLGCDGRRRGHLPNAHGALGWGRTSWGSSRSSDTVGPRRQLRI